MPELSENQFKSWCLMLKSYARSKGISFSSIAASATRFEEIISFKLLSELCKQLLDSYPLEYDNSAIFYSTTGVAYRKLASHLLFVDNPKKCTLRFAVNGLCNNFIAMSDQQLNVLNLWIQKILTIDENNICPERYMFVNAADYFQKFSIQIEGQAVSFVNVVRRIEHAYRDIEYYAALGNADELLSYAGLNAGIVKENIAELKVEFVNVQTQLLNVSYLNKIDLSMLLNQLSNNLKRMSLSQLKDLHEWVQRILVIDKSGLLAKKYLLGNTTDSFQGFYVRVSEMSFKFGDFVRRIEHVYATIEFADRDVRTDNAESCPGKYKMSVEEDIEELKVEFEKLHELLRKELLIKQPRSHYRDFHRSHSLSALETDTNGIPKKKNRRRPQKAESAPSSPKASLRSSMSVVDDKKGEQALTNSAQHSLSVSVPLPAEEDKYRLSLQLTP